jgi:negative regulator of replication initiation
MVRSDMSKPALIFFFTARVHITKSTVKILAANTHCKYFLKISEVNRFFCTRNRLYQRFVQPFLALTTAMRETVSIKGKTEVYFSDDNGFVPSYLMHWTPRL